MLDQNLLTYYSDGTSVASPAVNKWVSLHTVAGIAIAGGPLGTGTTGAWFVRSDKAIFRNVK